MAKGDCMTRDEFLVLARDALDELEHEVGEDEEVDDWTEVFLGYFVAVASKNGWKFETDDDDDDEEE